MYGKLLLQWDFLLLEIMSSFDNIRFNTTSLAERLFTHHLHIDCNGTRYANEVNSSNLGKY